MHAYQTGNFTVGEFLQWTARLDEMLAKLASKLNRNESFNPECSFQADVVFVSMPGPGSGRGNRYNPGRRCLNRENKKKRCVITIKNRDALCCARAIVTMRVHCHKGEGSEGHGQWENLKRGYPVQQRQAQELHHQAGDWLGSLWIRGAPTVSTCFGPSISTAGDEPYETFLFDLQGFHSTAPDLFTQIQPSFWWLHIVSCFRESFVLLSGLRKELQH